MAKHRHTSDQIIAKLRETEVIRDLFADLMPFRAVIEATNTYRWLYDLLAPMGTVLLAHPLPLRAMVVRRSKRD